MELNEEEPTLKQTTGPTSTCSCTECKKETSTGTASKCVYSDGQNLIDNSILMMERIAALYADRLLSDLTLVVGDKKYTAHRLILCTSSDVFQVMLMNPNWNESTNSIIHLNEDSECQAYFPDFLKYLYTGKIIITHANVLPILILSDKYNVQDLIKLSLDYMSSHIVKGATHNKLVSWLQYSMYCSHDTLAQSCLNFIAWNFELMADQDKDFASIDIDTMMTLLERDDLVVRDELTLFTCVSRWLFFQEKKMKAIMIEMTKGNKSAQNQESNSQLKGPNVTSERRRSSPTPLINEKESLDANFESLVKEVMTLIRFPMMSPLELANLLIDPLVTRFKGFLVDQMSGAMIYHNLHAPPSSVQRTPSVSSSRLLEVPKDHHEINNCLQVSVENNRVKRRKLNNNLKDDKSLIPRLYTNEKWSASLITENYSSVPVYGTRTLMFQTPSSLFHEDNSYQRRSSSPSMYQTNTGNQQQQQIPSSVSPSNLSSTPTPGSNNNFSEWAIDLHPKGLWFKSFKLIVWHGTLECPEAVIKTVRLSVTSLRARNEKVKIGILIYGRQEGIDFIKQITSKIHTFNSDDNMININDLIPYESLNVPLSDALIYTPRSKQVTMSNKSGFLIGPNNDTFKIHVVITPLTNY